MPSLVVAAVAALFVSAFVAGCGEPRAPAPSPPVVAPSASSSPIPPGVEGLADTAAPPAPSAPPSASASAASAPGADGAECDARHPCAAGLSCVYPCGIPGCAHRCTSAPPASPYPRSR